MVVHMKLNSLFKGGPFQTLQLWHVVYVCYKTVLQTVSISTQARSFSLAQVFPFLIVFGKRWGKARNSNSKCLLRPHDWTCRDEHVCSFLPCFCVSPKSETLWCVCLQVRGPEQLLRLVGLILCQKISVPEWRHPESGLCVMHNDFYSFSVTASSARGSKRKKNHSKEFVWDVDEKCVTRWRRHTFRMKTETQSIFHSFMRSLKADKHLWRYILENIGINCGINLSCSYSSRRIIIISVWPKAEIPPKPLFCTERGRRTEMFLSLICSASRKWTHFWHSSCLIYPHFPLSFS